MASAVVVGCTDSGPKRYAVKGVVTFNKKPVPRGWVIFLSQGNDRQTTTIGSEGQYEVELPAGTYRVGVSAPRETTATGLDAFKAGVPPPYVPVRFSLPEHSGIVATVEAVDENEIDFPLQTGDSRSRR